MHQIERAVFDLRRGMPVVITSANEHETPVLVWPLEAIGGVNWSGWLDQGAGQAALVLTRHRLAALGHKFRAEAACLPLTGKALPSPDELYRLASEDGAAPDQRFDSPRPAGAAERGALALMRRALLVPAALTVRVDNSRLERLGAAVSQGQILRVEAADALRCFELSGGLVRRVSEADIPLAEAAHTRFILFREPDGLREHIAICIGQRDAWSDAVPLRLHSACLTGDLFGSLRCDCGEQLRNGVATIERLGGGVLLYLAQEGRGIGLANKLRAYTLQDQGHDTVDADQVLGFGEDERRYGVAVDMLAELNISRVRLLTNNPTKMKALADGGIEVVSREGLYGQVTEQNRRYLSAKANRSGHLLDEVLSSSTCGAGRGKKEERRGNTAPLVSHR
ncbi:MAG: GTP cyclohydrolase II RibA [Wenzhouxiangellaceae bacterium]|nr:MAG: GTP cyclohydrolase II RibA [Wenzhouxiangellaceae bacterium]